MTALNITDGSITHRKEIIQLFQMAIAKQWQASYLFVTKNHVTSHDLKLTSVDARDGTFYVDGEFDNLLKKRNESLMFRAQSGGLSVVFKSRLSKAANSETAISGHEHQVDLPYEVRCTQLRKSARVNLESLAEEVPVPLYLSMGGRNDGTVIDISTSGAKVRVNRDLSNEIKNLQVLDSCRISLPDDSVLQAGVQLMDMTLDDECDTTTLRCQFSDILSNNEEILEEFIANTQDQAETTELAIASSLAERLQIHHFLPCFTVPGMTMQSRWTSARRCLE